eukprot:1200127-Pyramimonas_sp.AAC.1
MEDPSLGAFPLVFRILNDSLHARMPLNRLEGADVLHSITHKRFGEDEERGFEQSFAKLERNKHQHKGAELG